MPPKTPDPPSLAAIFSRLGDLAVGSPASRAAARQVLRARLNAQPNYLVVKETDPDLEEKLAARKPNDIVMLIGDMRNEGKRRPLPPIRRTFTDV